MERRRFLANGPYAAWAAGVGIGAGSPQNAGHGYHSVRDYGAQGDGRADDTAAIQRAVNAAQRGTGGTVFLPPGVYRLTGSVRIDSARVSLLGAGRMWTELRPASGTDGVHVECPATGTRYVGDCVFADFAIRGGRRGIFISDAARGSLGVVRQRFDRLALLEQTDAGIRSETFEIIESVFSDVWCDGGQAFGAYLQSCVNLVTFINCQWRNTTSAGLYLFGTVPGPNVVSSVTLLNNLFEANRQTGLVLRNGRGVDIVGGWFEYNGRDRSGGPYAACTIMSDEPFQTTSVGFRRCQFVHSGPNDGRLAVQVTTGDVAGPLAFEDCAFSVGDHPAGRIDLGEHEPGTAVRIIGARPAITGRTRSLFAVDTDGSVDASGELCLPGVSTAQGSGIMHDVATAGCTVLRLTAASPATITGLSHGRPGRTLIVVNAGPASVTLASDHLGSRAANRLVISIPQLVLAPDETCQLWYDGESARWRVVSHRRS
jgi:hypothetical protein